MSGRVLGMFGVSLWCSNARVLGHHLEKVLGLPLVARRGLDEGANDVATSVLQAGRSFLMCSSALDPSSERGRCIAQHVARRGDSVGNVALAVDNVDAVFERATSAGGISLQEPATSCDERGEVHTAVVRSPLSELEHTLVDARGFAGPYMPGYLPVRPGAGAPSGLGNIDHLAVAVEQGQLHVWREWYRDAFGFGRAATSSIEDEHGLDVMGQSSGLRTISVRAGAACFVIVEPIDCDAKSQISEFLSFHRGSGVQHIALSSDRITESVRFMRRQGMNFIPVPETYYERRRREFAGHPVQDLMRDLEDSKVLVDVEGTHGDYLLQTFSHPLGDRPTLFFEVISRVGASGFGAGNIKALFESVEEMQRRRESAQNERRARDGQDTPVNELKAMHS